MSSPVNGIDLDQYRTRSKELLKAARSGDPDARDRIARSHPEGAAAANPDHLRLADAQLVLARENGFPSWRALKEYVEFRVALRALDAGDEAALTTALEASPGVVRYRCRYGEWYESGYFQGAMLLHHVAGNPIRCPLPPNILEITRILLAHGADPKATTVSNSTLTGLLLTSKQASEAGVALALMDMLQEAGAGDYPAGAEALSQTLANGAIATARELIARGVQMDVRHAAALGELRQVEELAGVQPELLEEALAFAAFHNQLEAARTLMRFGGRGDVLVRPGGHHPQTALHIAASNGDEAMARMLLSAGADATVLDGHWNGTAAGWARACGHPELAEIIAGFTAKG